VQLCGSKEFFFDMALGDCLITCGAASACEISEQIDCSWIKLNRARDD